MASLAAYIEAQDWLATVPEDTPRRADLADFLDRLPARYGNTLFDIVVARSILQPEARPRGHPPLLRRGADPVGGWPAKRIPGASRRSSGRHCTLLCSTDAKAEEGRATILKEAKIGQSSVAATIAATLAPGLGTGAATITGAVAIALAIISRVSPSAWCAMQSTE
jgi:hypothetical protein